MKLLVVDSSDVETHGSYVREPANHCVAYPALRADTAASAEVFFVEMVEFAHEKEIGEC